MKKQYMHTRSANESIKGYIYQFDASIMRILNLVNDEDKVEIEGIEDIDIYDSTDINAVQFKYYEGTEYNHSLISCAIRNMVKNNWEREIAKKGKIKYSIIGYYKSGKEKLVLPITIDFLKKHFLTYRKNKVQIKHHEELGISDSELDDFLERLTIDVSAISYEKQKKEIMEKIKSRFSCDEIDAELLYYNSSLSLIAQLACEKKDRFISKRQFIERIDKKNILFNKWLLTLKGYDYWLKKLRKKIRPSINTSPFQRFFLINSTLLSNDASTIGEMIIEVHKKWSSRSIREPKPYCPIFYLHEMSSEMLVEVKKRISSNGYEIVDGYPFLNAPFDYRKILIDLPKGEIRKIRIANSLEDINEVIEKCSGIVNVFEFFNDMRFADAINNKGNYYSIDSIGIDTIKEILL